MDTFGKQFRVSVFGESHGVAVGALIDGVPAGLPLSESDFEKDISRRAARGGFTSERKEVDTPHILSGVFDGHTTGAPLCVVFRNSDVHSSDYDFLPSTPRPGHADYPAHIKFDGFEDYRGGGHFSGRLTLPIVAAGVVAKKVIGSAVDIRAEVCELAGSRERENWQRLLEAASAEGDSLGAVVSCHVDGLPIGLGEPFWDGMESLLSHAVFSIPGVRGIEFGDGFEAARMRGSQHNDPIGPEGPVKNGSGGINGGLTNGASLCFRVAFKPTSSISKPQTTFNFEKECEQSLSVGGRHDVCFALRAPVVVEAMCAIVLADLL